MHSFGSTLPLFPTFRLEIIRPQKRPQADASRTNPLEYDRIAFTDRGNVVESSRVFSNFLIFQKLAAFLE
jgi:hypothetical protein